MSLQTTNLTTNTTTPSSPESIVFPLGITGHLCAVPLCSNNNTAIMQSCCNGNPTFQYTYPGINEGNKTCQGLYCFLSGTMGGNQTSETCISCVDEVGYGGVMGSDEGKYTDKKEAGQKCDDSEYIFIVLVIVKLVVRLQREDIEAIEPNNEDVDFALNLQFQELSIVETLIADHRFAVDCQLEPDQDRELALTLTVTRHEAIAALLTCTGCEALFTRHESFKAPCGFDDFSNNPNVK
ncbi:hypothetical protein KCU61_g1598, partial [Aureobasidium melanogenum]